MRTMALRFGDKVRVRSISGSYTVHALRSTIMRSMHWLLPAIIMTEDECTHIMVSIIINELSKLQVIRYIKRYVIYEPFYLQGMWFKSIYTLLDATHLSLVTQFFKTNTGLGRLIETFLECLMMELGLPRCYFSYNYTKYSDYTAKSWIKHLWKYCHT